jgi:hypothetical protein
MGKRSNEYSAPAHKSSTIRGSYMSDDSVGVSDGLSARKDFDSEMSSCVSMNNEASVSENPRACIEPRKGYSVSEKGHSFTVGD